MIMASSSSTTSSNKSMIHVVEKPSTQEPLKCPRCDSSNTKFCYYNNYSLSQPRHFCKSCKRYWTRGGTLRNVPVGGGCRKNKRIKRQPPPNNGGLDVGVSTAVTRAATTENPSFLLQPHVADLSHSSSISTSSLLYNLPTASNINNPLDFSFPFSNLSSSKVNPSDHSAGLIFDLQPHQVNSLGIGFSSSSGLVENSGGIHQNSSNEFMRNGLMKNFLQDHVMNSSSSTSASSSSVFNNSNNNNPILFGSSTAFSTSSSSTTMASLLALKDCHTRSNFQGLMPYHHENHNSTEPNIRGMIKLGQNGSGWNPDPDQNSNTYNISHINSSDDPNSNPIWNTNNVSSPWFDPSNNIGSSVSSLI